MNVVKINKSDGLHLVLADFLEKYEKRPIEID